MCWGMRKDAGWIVLLARRRLLWRSFSLCLWYWQFSSKWNRMTGEMWYLQVTLYVWTGENCMESGTQANGYDFCVWLLIRLLRGRVHSATLNQLLSDFWHMFCMSHDKFTPSWFINSNRAGAINLRNIPLQCHHHIINSITRKIYIGSLPFNSRPISSRPVLQNSLIPRAATETKHAHTQTILIYISMSLKRHRRNISPSSMLTHLALSRSCAFATQEWKIIYYYLCIFSTFLSLFPYSIPFKFTIYGPTKNSKW